MTDQNIRVPQPGDRFHVLVSGFSIHTSAGSWNSSAQILDRGQTVTVTQELLDATRDRYGNYSGWVVELHDEARQIARWGERVIAPGPAPEGMQPWVYGDAVWRESRERARAIAWAETDPAERDRRLRQVEAEFGPAKPNDGTLRYRTHPTERAARDQEEQFRRDRASGAR